MLGMKGAADETDIWKIRVQLTKPVTWVPLIWGELLLLLARPSRPVCMCGEACNACAAESGQYKHRPHAFSRLNRGAPVACCLDGQVWSAVPQRLGTMCGTTQQ